jgi:Ca2+-binding RTX toxin-like protein
VPLARCGLSQRDRSGVSRLNPDGSLEGGAVTVNFGTDASNLNAVALQPDGKIVVAGEATTAGQDRFAVARLNADKSFDASFDGDGRKTIDHDGSDRATVKGSAGNDRLYGQNGKDRLAGGAGNDRLSGDAGKDSLAGGSGTDRLRGGGGRDSCNGGAGKDRAACERRRGI